MMMDDLCAAANRTTIWVARRARAPMRPSWRTGTLVLGLVALCLLLVADAGTAHAATFFVEDGAAVGDGDPGDGVCKSKLRPGTLLRNCTLMAAVEEANALSGFHTIMVPAGRFRFDAFKVGEDRHRVTRRMRIVGHGAAITELTAGGLLGGDPRVRRRKAGAARPHLS